MHGGDRKRKERTREKEKRKNERRNYHVTTPLQIIKKNNSLPFTSGLREVNESVRGHAAANRILEK